MRSLLSNTQLGEFGADGIERRSHLIRRRQHVVFGLIGGAIRQQLRCWIGTGVDLDSIQHDLGGLDVVTGQRLASVDRIVVAVPAVLCVQAVSQQIDDLSILVRGGPTAAS
jgi:hypothetical protein